MYIFSCTVVVCDSELYLFVFETDCIPDVEV